MSFYYNKNEIIVLPSDGSSEYYPNNTISKYTIKLPEEQNFSNNYEVALLEFIYPNSVRNITDQSFFQLRAKGYNKDFSFFKHTLDSGLYNEKQLLDHISNKVVNLDITKIKSYCEAKLKEVFSSKNIIITKIEFPTITKDSITGKVNINCGQILFSKDNVSNKLEIHFAFDDALFKILGYTGKNLSCDKMKTASNVIDILGQVHIIYIYSDVVSPIIVGNKRVNLLQMFTLDHPNKTSLEIGSLNRITFQSPMYVPLSRKTFDTISIEVRDDFGDLIQFETGKCLATLHFREKMK